MNQNDRQGSKKKLHGRRSRHLPAGARDTALDILIRVEQNQSYSNLELNRTLKNADFDRKDKGFITELVYGTLTRQLTLDWMISRYVQKDLNKLDPWVHQLLRLSFYQIHYLDKVPARAAVHEAVEIAKKRGNRGISGFVNGVLRNFLRNPEKINIPESWPLARRMSIELSHPEWLISRWLRHYGEEATWKMAEANNRPPSLSVRVNRLKMNPDQLYDQWVERFGESQVKRSRLVPECILLSRSGQVLESDAFQQGIFSVQDESSALVGHFVNPHEGAEVLDACAAPGGKTTHMAELMNNRGNIIAADIHEHKKVLISEQAERLGISIIEPITADALQLTEVMGGKTFDYVLLDAPCTGFGVIRRKPDLKWRKHESDIDAIADIQRRMIRETAQLVKPGGILVYSTCTVEPEENEWLVKQFVDENEDFVFDPEGLSHLPESVRLHEDTRKGFVQILPHHFDSDGFFIARMKRIK